MFKKLQVNHNDCLRLLAILIGFSPSVILTGVVELIRPNRELSNATYMGGDLAWYIIYGVILGFGILLLRYWLLGGRKSARIEVGLWIVVNIMLAIACFFLANIFMNIVSMAMMPAMAFHWVSWKKG